MTESASIMRFKAQIRNYAKAYAVPAQTAMQKISGTVPVVLRGGKGASRISTAAIRLLSLLGVSESGRMCLVKEMRRLAASE